MAKPKEIQIGIPVIIILLVGIVFLFAIQPKKATKKTAFEPTPTPIILPPAQKPMSPKLFDIPARYADTKRNEWVPVNTNIIASSEKNYDYMNVTNNFKTYISSQVNSKQNNLKIQKDGSSITFRVLNSLILRNKDQTGKEFVSAQKNADDFKNIKGQKISNSEGLSNQFKFAHVYTQDDANIDVIYTIYSYKLTEEIILNKFMGFPEFSQILELENTYIKQDARRINFYNKKTNEIVWHIEEPMMYEQDNPQINNYGLYYNVQCVDPKIKLDKCNLVILSKVIDTEGKNWLSDPKRKYPVVIDPNIVIDNADTASNWVSSNAASFTVSQDTTNKTEGTGSVKLTATKNQSCWSSNGSSCDATCLYSGASTYSVYTSCVPSSCGYGRNTYSVSGAATTKYQGRGVCSNNGTGSCYRLTNGLAGYTGNSVCGDTTCLGYDTYYDAPACSYLTGSSSQYVYSTKSALDLSSIKVITFWIRSDRIGTFLKFRLSENSNVNDAASIDYPIAISAANTWQKVNMNISNYPATQRDAINVFSFWVTDASTAFTFNFDDIRAEDIVNDPTKCVILENPLDGYLIPVWQDNANNETGYVLQKSINGGAFSDLVTLGAGITGYQDNAISQGNTYAYQVRGYQTNGYTIYSAWCKTTTLDIKSGNFTNNGDTLNGVKLN